jgi:hypothetical protein
MLDIAKPAPLFAAQSHYGVPAAEIAGLVELLNELDLTQQDQFGDIVSAFIVRNVKAADLKGQQVSIRGLARVVDMQPATLRRRIAKLIEEGRLYRDETGLHYAAAQLVWGAPASRRALLRMAGLLKHLGWGDFHPPQG